MLETTLHTTQHATTLVMMNGTTKVSKGFEISFNERYHLLNVRAWGLWDKEFAQKCCRMLVEKIRETGGTHKNWSMLIDMADLHPQSPARECLAAQQIESAQAQRVRKIGILDTAVSPIAESLTSVDDQGNVRIGSKEEIWNWLTQQELNAISREKESLNAV